MFELQQCLSNASVHAQSDRAPHAIPLPLDANAALLCFWVDLERATLFNCLCQVSQVGLFGAADQKVIHCKCEINVPCVVAEATFCKSMFLVTCFRQLIHQVIMDNLSRLLQAAPSFVNASVDETILLCCWTGKFTLIDDCLGNEVQAESDVLCLWQCRLEVHVGDVSGGEF